MKKERRNRRPHIVEATIQLVARQGVSGASMREIASAAGVTEGALYRHFASKEDLCQQAYCQVVNDMAGEKEQILASASTTADKVGAWIRVSFAYFDRYPEAFTYVLLTDHEFSDDPDDITRRQGRLLTRLLATAIDTGQMMPMDPVLAMCHLTGIMLNVPRLINEGTLPPPASDYADAVTQAAIRMFRIGDHADAQATS